MLSAILVYPHPLWVQWKCTALFNPLFLSFLRIWLLVNLAHEGMGLIYYLQCRSTLCKGICTSLVSLPQSLMNEVILQKTIHNIHTTALATLLVKCHSYKKIKIYIFFATPSVLNMLFVFI